MPPASALPLKSAIVSLLRSGSLSIAELQLKTEVSLPTLRRALRELINRNWIVSVGRSSKTGGRPATLYGLNDVTHMILGIHLELPGVHFALTDINGEAIEQSSLPGDRDLHPNDFVRLISKYARQVEEAHSKKRLIGLGIATPGYVDPASGDVLFIGRAPSWPNFPLQARLEAELGFPVAVENDVDCMTLAEISSIDSISDDLLYIGLIEGVKASMVLNGQLYKGPFGNAGLIGHTTVEPDGPSCSCGKKGCLETVASVRAANEHLDERLAMMKDSPPALSAIARIEDRTARFQAILEAASTGDETCSDIVARMIDALAQAIANLVYVLQAGTVIIGGALSDMPHALHTSLENEVRSRLSPLLSHHLVIKSAQITSSYAAATGASYRLFERVISVPGFDEVDLTPPKDEYAVA